MFSAQCVFASGITEELSKHLAIPGVSMEVEGVCSAFVLPESLSLSGGSNSEVHPVQIDLSFPHIFAGQTGDRF